MSSLSADLPIPEGPGSVSRAPNLPDGFTGTFTSRYIDTGDLRLHAVTGGDGPPLLLVHGWPQTWYAWRLLMPELARDFTVIAVDQRGYRAVRQARGRVRHRHPGRRSGRADGRPGPPAVRRGTATTSACAIAYALAADHPDRIERLAVAETPLPGDLPVTAAVRPRAR